MIVTLLGSGTPIPSADRFGSAILVEARGLFLLFDCGRGATIRLHQAGVSPRQIERVFFTHLHSDHVVGLPDLWLTGWILGRGEPLRIAGPDGTVEMASHLVLAYAADLHIRQHAAENLPAHGAGLDAQVVRSGVVHDNAGVRIRAFPVDHGHVTPAFGYRIEDGERAVVVSGDTKWSRSLIEASAGADLLVHSAWMPESANAVPRDQRSIASAEDAGRVFAEVRPKLAVVYHYLDQTGIEDAVRSTYSGSFVVGRDLLAIDVTRLE